MPFDFATCVRAFKLAYADKPDPRRFVGLTLLLIFGPPVMLVNALSLFLDRVFFPGFTRTEVKAPVFIVGNARSGTTFMHRLMCEDGQRFTYFRAWELFWPSLLQKKLIRALIGVDDTLFGGAIGKGVHRVEDRAFEKARDIHPLTLTGAEEDETLLVHIFFSTFVNILFPYLRPDQLGYLHFFDRLPAEKRQEVMSFYKECVQRQLYLDGGGKILCSKNPLFTTKMRSLKEMFPDARFVYMVRHPYETVPSLQNMMYSIWKAAWCNVTKDCEAVRLVGETSLDVYKYALEVFAEWPEESWIMVRYEDLVSDPRGTVEKVYSRLGMDVGPELAQALQAEADKAKAYKSKHEYSLEEFGMDKAHIQKELAEVFRRFGWDPS